MEQVMTAHRKPSGDTAASFVRRHIGPSARDVTAMHETDSAKSNETQKADTQPTSIRQAAPLDLGKPLSETEAIAHMGELARQNQDFTSLIGQGYSGTNLPAVIQCIILD